MVTPNSRTLANEKNALKSTGPRTLAGKASSSANAVQHGILSRHLILPGESRGEFDALLSQLLAEHKPVGTIEMAIVERMAIALWRQRRLIAAETGRVRLQQMIITVEDHVRIKQISGVIDPEYIKDVARNPLPNLIDLEMDLAECKSWLAETPADAEKDLLSWPIRLPRLWDKLAEQGRAKTPEELIKGLSRDKGDLKMLVDRLRLDILKLHRVASAVHQTQQATLIPHESDIFSRYQTHLDNDLYKAMRVLRDAQTHRLHQAAVNATPIESGS